MAIVSNETVNHCHSLRRAAQDCGTYEKGYRLAMEGLNAAIAQLEQLQMVTQNFEVKVVQTG